MTAEIIGDKGLLPIFWEMPARKDFETAMLGAARVQTLNHTLGTNSGCIVGTGDNIINAFATRTIGCKRLAPLIKMMAPAIDQTTHGDFEFKIFRTKLPDAPATQTLGPVWSFQMAMNVNRLIEIKQSIHAPTQRMHHVMGIFSTKTRKDYFSGISLAIAIGITEVNKVGTIDYINSAIAGSQAGGDKKPISKDGCFVCDAIAIGIFHNQNFILVGLPGKHLRIGRTTSGPKPALGIEADLNGFCELRIARKQIDFKPLWKNERFTLIFWVDINRKRGILLRKANALNQEKSNCECT